MKPRQIFTLDARDNVFLQVVSVDSGAGDIHKFINHQFDQMAGILRSKGLEYNDLKSALVPQTDKREIAFVFNRFDIDSAWYGNEVFDQLIPLLSKNGSHSILHGDMVGFEHYKDKIKEEFLKDLIKVREVKYEWQNQFYIVYLNNLTDGMVSSITDGLKKYRPYVGNLDLTYVSFMKTYLSFVLANCCLKSKKTVLSGHEPDRDDSEDINLHGYDFEGNGYICRSLSDDYFGIFLSYKIERRAYSGEKDSNFSINALSPYIHDLSRLDIQVDERKLGYLISEKRASLKRAELLGLTTDEIAKFIKNKIDQNYIYNLTYLPEFGTLKFNVIIENRIEKLNKFFKIMVSLEYMPKDKSLRLITLF